MTSQRDLLAAAIDIRSWLDADAGLDIKTRIQRDRAIGKRLPESDHYLRVLAWWHALEVSDQREGERIASFVSLANGLLLIAGTLSGIVIAGASFAYRGDYPVNLFALLGVLVGIPTLMLIIQIFALAGVIPIPSSIREAAAVLSPGRWAGAWLQRNLPIPLFETVARQRAGTAFARWQLIEFGQSFAIGFFIGTLVLSGILIVFTDLAFGWSTTLDVEAGPVASFLAAIATPWMPVLPSAAPDLALVEASRFFRLEDSSINHVRATQLGQWWPFVIMTITVYGLLPRLLLARVAAHQVRRETRRLLEEGPAVTALLDRLAAQPVEFESSPDDRTAPADGIAAQIPALTLEPGATVIVWNRAVDESAFSKLLARHNSPEITRVFAEEGEESHAHESAIEGVALGSRVVVLTKGWEPPLLSFNDFVGRIRSRIGSDGTIVVVPLAPDLLGVDSDGQKIWSTALARCDDPALYVAEAAA